MYKQIFLLKTFHTPLLLLFFDFQNRAMDYKTKFAI